MCWIDFTSGVSLIHFTLTFRASERLISHPALPGIKGFPGIWDFQIFKKTRTVLGKPGQVGSVVSTSLPGMVYIHYIFFHLEYLFTHQSPYYKSHLLHSNPHTATQLFYLNSWSENVSPYLKPFLISPCLQEVVPALSMHTWPSMIWLLPQIPIPTPLDPSKLTSWPFISFHWPLLWFGGPFSVP